MTQAGPPTASAIARRAALALLVAVVRPARAAPLAEAPTLLVAGPEGGWLDQWAVRLSAALAPGLPAGTRLQRSAVGGEDGVTGANQFATRMAPDGNTLLLVPGAAALAWQVGDPRARFDAAQWLGVVACTMPAVVVGRGAAWKPGASVRVGMAGPVGPDLPALLGLELAGLTPVPVFGALEAGAAAQALSAQTVDAVLLRGRDISASLGPLAQVGASPLFALTSGEARDPAWLAVPTLAEYAAGRGATPSGELLAAWRGTAAAAQTEYALVLPHLTPAALVALWRQAGNQAASAVQETDTRSMGAPAAHALAQAMAPDVAALLALRGWLAGRLGWKAG